MKEQADIKQNMINFGLIYGITSIVFHLTLYALNKHLEQDWRIGMIGFLILAVLVIFGIKKFKSFNNGFISISQSIKTGIGIAAVGALLYSIYIFVFMNFIEPETMNQTLAISREAMIEKFPDMSIEKIDANLEIQKAWSGPGVIGAVVVFFNLFMGLIISFISGLFLRKEDTTF